MPYKVPKIKSDTINHICPILHDARRRCYTVINLLHLASTIDLLHRKLHVETSSTIPCVHGEYDSDQIGVGLVTSVSNRLMGLSAPRQVRKSK